MSNDRLMEMAKTMRQYQALKEALEAELKDLNVAIDQLRFKDIPEFMAENDIRSVTFDGIGRVQLAADVYATILDKEAGYAWLASNGYEGLIQNYIQPSTFKAAVKEAMKGGQEFPPEL